VFGEAAAAVEFDGGITVVDFEVENLGVVLTRSGFSERKQLAADSLPAMLSFDEEFVNPGAFAAVFEAVIEADHKICDWHKLCANDIGDAANRILQKLGEIGADRDMVKRLRPGIIHLHVAHHFEKVFEVGGGSLGDGGNQRVSQPCTASNLEYVELIVN
jgi:hypothetical protein